MGNFEIRHPNSFRTLSLRPLRFSCSRPEATSSTTLRLLMLACIGSCRRTRRLCCTRALCYTLWLSERRVGSKARVAASVACSMSIASRLVTGIDAEVADSPCTLPLS